MRLVAAVLDSTGWNLPGRSVGWPWCHPLGRLEVEELQTQRGAFTDSSVRHLYAPTSVSQISFTPGAPTFDVEHRCPEAALPWLILLNSSWMAELWN